MSTERQIGWATGPIPYHAIRSYGIAEGLDPTTMILFTRVIREMDAAYLEWLGKERERKSKEAE